MVMNQPLHLSRLLLARTSISRESGFRSLVGQRGALASLKARPETRRAQVSTVHVARNQRTGSNIIVRP
jgi:hypothetical protein